MCPDATLVDIGHEIPPHDVLAGALELAACYRYFPGGTVFLVVVDPGVGSSAPRHRGGHGRLSVRGARQRRPDGVFRETPPKRVVELTERKYARPTVSRTFEGRDRFAPAAGWLAKGIVPDLAGRPSPTIGMLAIAEPDGRTTARFRAKCVRVDRFGNLIIEHRSARTFDRLARRRADRRHASAAHEVRRLVATYAEAAPGEVCALFGSTDHLEIAVNGGSAAAALWALARGAPVDGHRAGSVESASDRRRAATALAPTRRALVGPPRALRGSTILRLP